MVNLILLGLLFISYGCVVLLIIRNATKQDKIFTDSMYDYLMHDIEVVEKVDKEDTRMKVRNLKEMPFDMAFETRNGVELCHATGIEVQFPDVPDQWWNEYEDSEGNFHYGR